MKKDNITYLLIALILLAGLYMRTVGLGSVSLSNDELSALNRTQFADLGTMLQEGVIAVDYHPVGVQTFLYAWTNVFGMNTWLVRLPFMLMGLAAVWLTFLVGKAWGKDKTGLIAAAFMAGLAFPILYSRLARPYAPALLCVLGAAYYWTKVVKAPNETPWKALIGFVVCGVLAAWSHYFAAVTVAFLGLLGFLFVRRKSVLPYLLSGLAMLLIAAIHWPITRAQLNNDGLGGSEGWLDPPGEDWLFEFLSHSFNGRLFFWITVCLTFTGIWFLIRNKLAWRPFTLFLVLFVANYAFGHWYSTAASPILQYSGLLFSFPFLLIAFSYAIAQIPIPTKSILPVGLLILCLYTSLNMPGADPYGVKQLGRFKELATAFDTWEKQYPEDIAFAVNVNDPFYMRHYFKSEKKLLVDVVKEREDMFAFREALENSTSSYFAFCWSTIQMPPEAFLLIKQFYPYEVEVHKYFNSEAILYSRTKPANHQELASWDFGGEWLAFPDSSDIYYLENEYSPNVVRTAQQLRELSGEHTPYVIFEVTMRAPPESNPVLIMDWQRKGKNVHWSGSELNQFYPSGEWRTLSHTSAIPEHVWMDDELKLYIWNRGPGRLEIKSVKTRLQVRL